MPDVHGDQHRQRRRRTSAWSSTNQGGDQFDIELPSSGTPGTDRLVVHVDGNDNGTYESASTRPRRSRPGAQRARSRCSCVGDTPDAAVNGQPRDSSPDGGCPRPDPAPVALRPGCPTPGARYAPRTCEIVVAQPDGESRIDTFDVQTAALAVTKTSSVISDPITVLAGARRRRSRARWWNTPSR